MTSPTRHLALAAAAAVLSLTAQADPAVYPNPGTPAPASSFVAAASGQLTAYYTGAAGGLTVLLGARLLGVDGPLGLTNHGSAYGESFVLGNVSAGDTIVFYIDINNTGERYYSDPSLNAGGVNHAWAAPYAGDALVPAGINVAFEDLPGGGDLNYADHSFVFQISAVPEPASWALLLGGVAALALRRRR